MGLRKEDDEVDSRIAPGSCFEDGAPGAGTKSRTYQGSTVTTPRSRGKSDRSGRLAN